MKSTKIILKMIFSYLSKVIVGAFFILLLSLLSFLIKNHNLPFEWFYKISYYIIGLQVLYSIGNGMGIQKLK